MKKTIWIRARKAPPGSGLLDSQMRVRKTGISRRYWTEIPEEVDADDKRVNQLLQQRELIMVDKPLITSKPAEKKNAVLLAEEK